MSWLSIKGNLVANASSFGSSEWLDTFLSTVVYSALGLFIFAVVFVMITKLAPFSIRKEIEEDQNTSLSILIGSIMLSLAIIIGSSISG